VFFSLLAVLLSFGVVGSCSVSEEVISTAKNTEEYSSGTVVRLNAFNFYYSLKLKSVLKSTLGFSAIL